jgi:hypothetical protein
MPRTHASANAVAAISREGARDRTQSVPKIALSIAVARTARNAPCSYGRARNRRLSSTRTTTSASCSTRYSTASGGTGQNRRFGVRVSRPSDHPPIAMLSIASTTAVAWRCDHVTAVARSSSARGSQSSLKDADRRLARAGGRQCGAPRCAIVAGPRSHRRLHAPRTPPATPESPGPRATARCRGQSGPVQDRAMP